MTHLEEQTRTHVPQLLPLLRRHASAANLGELDLSSVLGQAALCEALDRAAISSLLQGWQDRELADEVQRLLVLRMKLSFLSTLSTRELSAYSALGHPAQAEVDLLHKVKAVWLQGEEFLQQIVESAERRQRLLAVISAALPYAQRTEVIVTQGADERSVVNADAEKQTPYFSTPVPQPGASVRRSSCTCSSATEESFHHLDQTREFLLSQALNNTTAAQEQSPTTTQDRIRQRISNVLGLADNASAAVLLTPSGTDAELIPALIARAVSRRLCGASPRVVSLVVSAGEVGSGTAFASGARAFSPILPRPGSKPTVKGAHIEGVQGDEISVVEFPARDGSGSENVPEEQIAQKLEQVITEPGTVAVLHAVLGSKTGLCFPSCSFLESQQAKYGQRLVVVVDACQMRTLTPALETHLEAARVLLVTGSKFFCGPPFSGAAILPGSFVNELEAEAASANLPPGLCEFLSAENVPRAMTALRSVLRSWPNPGLELRWEGALCNMEKFATFQESRTSHVAALWASRVRSVVPQFAPYVVPLVVNEPPANAARIGDTNTIVSLFVCANGSNEHIITVPGLKKIHRLLTRDLSTVVQGQHTEKEISALKMCCAVGQPVLLDAQQRGVLRLALGAEMVNSVLEGTDENTSDEDISQRVDQLVLGDHVALTKLTLIAKHWTHLEAL